MPIKKGEPIILDITAMASEGRGIGRVDGLAVFVEQTVPGDRVSAAVVRKRKNHAEARLMDLLVSSPFRTSPPCPYFGFCGGCKWQHVAYDRQLEFKRRQVIDALERIAGIPDVFVHPVIPSQRVYGYRNKMEFSCADRRWLLPQELETPDTDAGFALGLHVPGTFDKIIDIRRCLLQPDTGNAILDTARSLIRHSGAPPYGLKSHRGFWRFVMLRHAEASGRWMVNLVTASEDLSLLRPIADAMARAHPQILTVVNNITSKKAGIAVGEREIALIGPSMLRDRLGPYEFRISANSFFQVNTLSAGSLFQVIQDAAGLKGIETVLDLYCGTGAIAIALSGCAKTITGIEILPDAVKDAQENCRINGITNCRFLCGDILNLITGIEQRPDVVVIDPPRSGMHPKAVKQVLDFQASRMIYVSCNPATLARDLGFMKEGYAVLEARPVDMFPHTPHIETVVTLQKREYR